MALSIKEIGYSSVKKQIVIASTIPHLRPEKMKEIEIPLIDQEAMGKITKLVKKSFEYYNKQKQLLHEWLGLLNKEIED